MKTHTLNINQHCLNNTPPLQQFSKKISILVTFFKNGVPFHQNINYWFKQINTQSTQAQLIQMFAALQDKELKAGIRVDLKSENVTKTFDESVLTYLFITYQVENNQINVVNLQQLEKCLENFTHSMSGMKFRKPATNTDQDSYLRPGYSCAIQPLKTND
jgi:hypothetical protein